jgi:hypothetical protein
MSQTRFRALKRFLAGDSSVRPSRFIPRMEMLERRETPANNVMASMSGTTLVITADDDMSVIGNNNNSITIQPGMGSGHVILSGNAITQINKLAVGVNVPFNNVTSIRCIMGLGSDSVTLFDVDLAGNLTVNGGDGNNFVVINANNNAHTIGSVTITNGDGSDNLTLQHATKGLTITGALTINNGIGGSSTTLGSAGDKIGIGSVSVTNGTGFDSLGTTAASFSTTGAMAINNGSGGSITNLRAATTTLGGLLSITNGAGNDNLQAGTGFGGDSFSASKGITIVNGTGGSSTDFEAGTTSITGNVAVTNLDGGDYFYVGTKGTANNFAVSGNVTINNGVGTSQTLMGTKVQTNVAGALSVTNGAGDNLFDLGGGKGGGFGLGSLSIKDAGGGSISFDAPTVAIVGAVTVVNGDGFSSFDTHQAGATTNSFSAGSVSITNGNGNSQINLRAANINAITGALTIKNGNGDNNLLIGAPGKGTSASLGSLTVNNEGGGGMVAFDAETVSFSGNVSVTNGDGNYQFDNNVSNADNNFSAGAVSIVDGNGDSNIQLHSNNDVSLTGNLSITNKAGFDVLTLSGGNSLSLKGVTINDGNGGSTTTLAGHAVSIDGNYSLSGGDGFQNFTSGGVLTNTVVVSGTLSFNVTDGSGQMTLNPMVSASLGALQVTGAGENMTLVIRGVAITGATNVTTGNGTDTVNIDDCTFNGAVNVNTGAGADVVYIEQVVTAKKTTFNGAVNINTGSGDDLVNIGILGDLVNFGAFAKSVTINGGTGLDTINYLSPPRHNTFAIAPSISGFEGIN